MKSPSLDDSDLAGLPTDLDAMVRSELAEGEKLLWVGQPHPGRMVVSTVPIAIFGVVFSGFSIVWMVMVTAIVGGGAAVATGRGVFGLFDGVFAVFGLPFLLVGLGMLASPFWAGRAATRTAYAVTDRRAILWQPTLWSGVQVRSYGPEQLGRMTRNQRGDGSGDLVFEEFTTYGPKGHRSVTRRGFFAIDRVHEVEALIRSNLLAR